MRQIAVTYHYEDGAWWAEAPDAPGFSALAATRPELDTMVVDGLKIHLEERELEVLRFDEAGSALDARAAFTPSPSLDRSWWTVSSSAGISLAAGRARSYAPARVVPASTGAVV